MISKITIINGTTSVDVTGSCILKGMDTSAAGRGDEIIEMSAVPGEANSFELSSPAFRNIYQLALNRISAENKYVATINGAVPFPDGNFFVTGSMCDSVEQETIASGTVGLRIYDMCPACRTCDTTVKLIKYAQDYKILVNAIKDVNLYGGTVYKARQDYLLSFKETFTGKCADVPTKTLVLPNVNVYKLLHQYLTTVHMWNYVVAERNSQTAITAAPDDNSGFVVQSKRGITSCGSSHVMKCVIDVEPFLAYDPTDANDMEGDAYLGSLSMYTEYKVDDQRTGNSGIKYAPFTTADAQPTTSSAIVHVDYLDKSVRYSITDIPAAGTFIASAKFLPFVLVDTYHVNSYNQYVPLDIHDWVGAWPNPYEESDEAPIDPTSMYKTGAEVSSYPSDSPSIADYQLSKMAPSVSSRHSIVWKVDVTWEIRKMPEDEEEEGELVFSTDETFLYTARGPRVPMGDVTTAEPGEPTVFRDTDVYSAADPTPENS